MPIITSQPTVIPPAAQVTCDHIWAEQIIITAPIDGVATAHIVTRPYAEDEAGNKTFAAVNQQRTYTVGDVDAAAANSTTVADAYAAILAAVQVIVTANEQPQGS